VLLSLLMVTAGAMLGGLGLSGYYEPRVAQDQAAVATVDTPQPRAKLIFATLQARQRFVAVDDAEPPAPMPPAKAKTAAKPASAKATKAEVKNRPEPKPRRPQQAAATWPWSLFTD
jgi:hypothetical protein